MMHCQYLVVGLGKTGLSIAHYLKRKNYSFMVFDTRQEIPNLPEFKKEFPDVTLFQQHFPDTLWDHITDIITSPGVPLDTPLIKEAIERGIPVYGDIECLAREITAPVIAITGTNGKSTVTTLVGEMAKAAGLKVAVAGNIGTPVLDLLEDGHSYDLWVLELSSFQLDLTYSLHSSAATILNITPDHLDRHHTLAAYVQAKQRVYQQAKVAIFNREDMSTMPNSCFQNHLVMTSFGQDTPAEGEWGLLTEANITYLAKGNKPLLAIESLLIKGIHNCLNALAACALVESIGVTAEQMIAVLTTFTGLSHRCQWVRSLNEVEWINDSKGTNVGATISAINGIGGVIQGRIVLIAGGQGKGADFNELVPSVTQFVRSVVVIGEDADKIECALHELVPITHALTLEDAVYSAKQIAQPHDVVLLSPACASLDMFRDFNHRGEVFIAAVNGLS